MIIHMRSCTCFLALQNHKCRMRLIRTTPILRPISFASLWYHNFCSIGSSLGRNSARPVRSSTSKHSREGPDLWLDETETLSGFKQQAVTKRLYVRKNATKRSKPDTVRSDELLDGVITANAEVHIKKSEVNELEFTNDSDVIQKIECRNIQRLATIFVFDIETTGLSREHERIIEFALRDLNGGENSTFQTLINPGCYVPNMRVHGISTYMVNRPSVPRFEALIPILLQYVQSRRVPNTPVIWVSHNARGFDVPFLINEFSRCSEEIPSDWIFLDTLPLARELAKLEGTKPLLGKSVQALRDYYGIPLVGKAHSAMSDVHSLSNILQEMTFDLKLPISSLLERTFKASDIGNTKKKTKKKS